ncbi:hypothetical protein BG015_001428 [Linnemannia schmuckeri]|uniref:HCP-like protein n=1 Tax=Linnemannia schmuckeri TaxID=64567 RepID=A0A9P5RPS7_9FUNG|nr:hypothetical protein BG015_001428 [Linnemannia schmuckeri]
MAPEDTSSDEHTQAVRRVYETELLNNNASLSKVFRLECHFDDVSGKNIILWEDILEAFMDVARSVCLDPLRIAAVPGVTLDVVVTGHLVRPESTLLLQEAQPSTPVKKSSLESLQKDKDQSRAPQEYASVTTQDFEETLTHARLGDKDTQVAIGDMYKFGQVVTQDYYAAMDWYLKAAEQKDPAGQRKVDLLYKDGLGVTQNYYIAMEWYLKATIQEHAPAQFNIGVPPDSSRAMEWYQRAADQGDADAQETIGWFYQHGLGVLKYYGKAMEWNLKAADRGNANAQCNIGYMYNHGLGVSQDGASALDWFRKSAEQGNTLAQYILGSIYEDGRGIFKDETKAMEWYKKAADKGNENAKKKINDLKQKASSVQTESKK